jgi:ACS family sodium-dependent inorganic phosphate cotransporter
VLGIIYSGLQVGNVLAYFISPYILDAAGWEGLFEIYGTVGILWLALWLSPIIKDKPETENALLAEVLPQKSLRESLSAIPWAQVFGSKEVRAISVAHSVGNFGMYINLAWVPTYYSSHFGLSAGESSVNSIAPWVCAAVCSSLAGGAADALLSRGISRTTVRRFMQSVALLVPAAAMLFLGLEPTLDPQETELCFVVACSASALGVAGFGSSVQDVCRSSKLTSLLYSVTSAPAVLCGSLGVYGTGLLLDAYQDWTLVFTATAAVYAIGAYYYATNYEAKKIFE